MRLYIKQKVFSWGDKFRIYDEYEHDKYYVEGEVFTLGKKLHLYNHAGEEMAFIRQKLWTFFPKFFISQNGTDVATVMQKWAFFQQKYIVEELGWTVRGNLSYHEFTISSANQTIASISKRWLSWGDTYEINVINDADEIMAICVVLIIDAIIAQIQSSTIDTTN